MISKQEVKHIAKLARLGLTEAEIDKFKEELSSILNYLEKFKKVDISKTEPTTHPRLIKNIMREDVAREEGIKIRKKYVRVKSVFNHI